MRETAQRRQKQTKAGAQIHSCRKWKEKIRSSLFSLCSPGEITSSHSSMAKKSGQTCVRCHISSLIDQISRLVSRSSRETRGCGGKTWTMFSCGFPPVFYSVITSHVECSRHRR
ncbi:hypothetical protein JOB18_026735 [Solea senegalensis]|uniref:Uncharacterized protein n=1 Tax=Solea senegalensis TaxID=28829 RepID=A0AAV6RCI2_SOLSE|nr:hypothetical protein JOB18_026735 [Solea senegalensis]